MSDDLEFYEQATEAQEDLGEDSDLDLDEDSDEVE